MANSRNIARVICAIEGGNTADIPEQIGFNMETYVERISKDNGLVDRSGRNRSLVACVAGFAYLIATRASLDEAMSADPALIDKIAAGFLELSPRQWIELFFDPPEEIELRDITAEQMVRTLKHLDATGEIAWFKETT